MDQMRFGNNSQSKGETLEKSCLLLRGVRRLASTHRRLVFRFAWQILNKVSEIKPKIALHNKPFLCVRVAGEEGGKR